MTDELNKEDRKLLNEVSGQLIVFNQRLDELRKILFGEHADGFLYKFAGMERDINSIPAIQKSIDELKNEVKALKQRVIPMEKKVAHHDRQLFKNKIQRGIVIAAISFIIAAITTLIAWLSGIIEIASRFSGSVGPKLP